MYIEITKEAFNALVADSAPVRRDFTEHTDCLEYYVKGCLVQELTNVINPVTQYYIRDINA